MPRASNEDIAAQYENNSIYLILSSRGALPGFHWGIFIPTESPVGGVWHATNREGGWKLERKLSKSVPFSVSLVVAYKIGALTPSNSQACQDVLDSVVADGTPSPNTGEEFSCRIWAKDAVIALEKNKIITLGKTLSALEKDVFDMASDHKDTVEVGDEEARVVND